MIGPEISASSSYNEIKICTDFAATLFMFGLLLNLLSSMSVHTAFHIHFIKMFNIQELKKFYLNRFSIRI